MPHHKHGFTIIEVSLVLAIAGLILVMAFIALPALQRQTRDSKRKEDTMTFLQALKKYQQNNRGSLPDGDYDTADSLGNYSFSRENFFYADYVCTWRDIEENDAYCQNTPWYNFYANYLGKNFTNPDGEKYTFLIFNTQLPAYDNHNEYHYLSISNQNAADENRDADMFIYVSATCENGQPVKTSNSRNLAIVTLLESGTYCANL